MAIYATFKSEEHARKADMKVSEEFFHNLPCCQLDGVSLTIPAPSAPDSEKKRKILSCIENCEGFNGYRVDP